MHLLTKALGVSNKLIMQHPENPDTAFNKSILNVCQINIHIYMKYYTGIRGKFRCKLCKKNGLDSEEALEFHIKNVHNMSEEYITKVMKLLLMNNNLKLDSNGTLY